MEFFQACSAKQQAYIFQRDYVSPTFDVDHPTQLELSTIMRKASKVVLLQFQDGLDGLVKLLTWPKFIWSYWNVLTVGDLLQQANTLEEHSSEFFSMYGLLRNLAIYYGYALFAAVPKEHHPVLIAVLIKYELPMSKGLLTETELRGSPALHHQIADETKTLLGKLLHFLFERFMFSCLRASCCRCCSGICMLRHL